MRITCYLSDENDIEESLKLASTYFMYDIPKIEQSGKMFVINVSQTWHGQESIDNVVNGFIEHMKFNNIVLNNVVVIYALSKEYKTI